MKTIWERINLLQMQASARPFFLAVLHSKTLLTLLHVHNTDMRLR